MSIRLHLGWALLLLACKSAPPEPEPAPARQPASTAAVAATPPASPATPPASSAAKTGSGVSVPVSPDDPLAGKLTLEEATKGLPGKGSLVAEIQTDHGKLSCELYDDKAPITVANFVGLARGLRPFKDPSGEWVKRPAYDGTTFHRIIKGFMIQGGDPSGTGKGQPGYVIPDEVWAGARHDRRGLLCMANRGKHTNGAQFFILDAAAPHLDGGYTIFGLCGPDKVIETLANAPGSGDRPTNPPKIKQVTIKRVPRAKP
jgi:peptidyl-prolyl cis-trans isomerase A (cyclophilin A)